MLRSIIFGSLAVVCARRYASEELDRSILDPDVLVPYPDEWLYRSPHYQNDISIERDYDRYPPRRPLLRRLRPFRRSIYPFGGFQDDGADFDSPPFMGPHRHRFLPHRRPPPPLLPYPGLPPPPPPPQRYPPRDRPFSELLGGLFSGPGRYRNPDFGNNRGPETIRGQGRVPLRWNGERGQNNGDWNGFGKPSIDRSNEGRIGHQRRPLFRRPDSSQDSSEERDFGGPDGVNRNSWPSQPAAGPGAGLFGTGRGIGTVSPTGNGLGRGRVIGGSAGIFGNGQPPSGGQQGPSTTSSNAAIPSVVDGDLLLSPVSEPPSKPSRISSNPKSDALVTSTPVSNNNGVESPEDRGLLIEKTTPYVPILSTTTTSTTTHPPETTTVIPTTSTTVTPSTTTVSPTTVPQTTTEPLVIPRTVAIIPDRQGKGEKDGDKGQFGRENNTSRTLTGSNIVVIQSPDNDAETRITVIQ